MKQYIKTLMVATLIVFSGCSDLVEEPKSILAPEGFFESYSDVEAAMFGVYGRMTSDVAWGGEFTQALLLLSDMVDVGNPGAAAQNFEINEFRATPENYYSTIIWPRAFDIINAANTTIKGARQVDIEASLKERLEAEARALRAIAYFTYVQVFGDMPYFDAPVTKVSEAINVERTPESEIYARVIEDLEYAFVEGRLPNQYDASARTRVTRGVVATTMAAAYLNMENWQEAYDYAKWVIDNKADFGYDLVDDYQDLFNAAKQDGIAEHVLAVDFLGQQRHSDNDDTMSPLTGVGQVSGSAGGWSIIVPSMDVYEDWDDRDYRKGVAFDTTVANANGELIHYTDFPVVKRPHIAKYNRFVGNNSGSGRRSDFNYPIFRYAEVLLIAAEALNELSGPTAEAVGYVNEIRARARIWPDAVSTFPPDVVAAGQTKDSFRDIVLEERRLELSFEYKRWFDIKRRNLGEEVFKGAGSLEPQPNFDPNTHYLLPVPQSEIDINPNIIQNSGY